MIEFFGTAGSYREAIGRKIDVSFRELNNRGSAIDCESRRRRRFLVGAYLSWARVLRTLFLVRPVVRSLT